MNIEVYSIDKNSKVLKTQIFAISDDLFENLSKSEFSELGASRKIPVTIDDEIVEIKLVQLSRFVRNALTDFLKDFLVKTLMDSLIKMGESPSTIEYQEYTKDLKDLSKIIQCLENEKFTHLYRIG